MEQLELLSRQADVRSYSMRFQDRDGKILETIYKYDGVLAKRHIKQLFWADATWRAMEMRLSLLHQYGYIAWANESQRRNYPIVEPVCWLGWRGIQWIANQSGIEILITQNPSETKLRQMQHELRQQSIRWVREPRWFQLGHDLAIVDFRLAIEKSILQMPNFILEKWITEGEFFSQMDTVQYQIARHNGENKEVKRGVRPDGYFVIIDRHRQTQGLPCRLRFLLEMDMATHDVNSFVVEKAMAGFHYIGSAEYKIRFGDNSGRWLVVTTSEIRQKHLAQSIHQSLGEQAKCFLFTTLGKIEDCNLLAMPIWWNVMQTEINVLLKK